MDGQTNKVQPFDTDPSKVYGYLNPYGSGLRPVALQLLLNYNSQHALTTTIVFATIYTQYCSRLMGHCVD